MRILRYEAPCSVIKCGIDFARELNLSAMRIVISLMIVFLTSLTACSSVAPAAVVELDGEQIPSVTPRIIYVTPTRQPTSIPTASMATQAPTSAPIRASETPESLLASEAQCLNTLEALYLQASEACIGEPSGFFCNGGLPPQAEPSGNAVNVSNTLAVPGSLVPANVVGAVDNSPLLRNDSGGLMWVRLEEPIGINALLIGDVDVRDITPPDSNLQPWQSLTVTTGDASIERLACSTQPYSTLIVQGPWGASTNIAINGVSIELTGSLAVQTSTDTTHFMALEGESLLTIFGQDQVIVAGQQLDVPYNNTSFTQPIGMPNEASLLSFGRIANIPIPLLDRPILLPQPGFARTSGNVNMRIMPSTNSQIIAEVPAEQLLSIIGMNIERTWYHVRLPNGDNGWMRADLVSGQIGDISVTYDNTPLPPERYGESGHAGLVIAANGANLRRAPDIQFDVIETLPENSTVEILARSPYSPFVKVESDAGIGWLSLTTLETTTVIQFLPIDYDVPLPPGPTPTPFFAFGGGHAYPDPRAGN
ncbi:MAG: SH3 domain-containing protein [Anaerolineae bacterium]